MGLLSRLFEPDQQPGQHRDPAASTGPGPGAAREHDDSVPALRKQTQALVLEINASAGDLPPIAVVLARAVTDTVASVLDSPEVDRLDIGVRVAVHAVLIDYVPGSIRSYIGAVRAAGDPAVHAATDAVVEQLTTLRASVGDLAAASNERDLQALQVHGRFLQDKFGGSELDL
ncbi:hypothetical protein [Allobranchiibius huperziae]|uniref:Uncharacterized protein n=1 Tax=Allobranchiibius huperziae TaxID=1874116 RepID=A0A853DEF6_9MICO|nr:hypothetical protein [Allobranchiibius huperziae]NYJ73060.1 hypothetical protein [Allobranchiibius huperziae]